MTTHPQKLSELLELTTASRHIAEHNSREVARTGAHREFSDDDGTGGIVGDKMAARLLGRNKRPSKWEQEKAAMAKQLAEQKAITDRNYRKLMYG